MQALVQTAQALADVTRLRIIMILLQGEATVSDLVVRLEVPQPRISTHLALLRRAGLVSVDAAGRQRTYRVDTQRVGAVLTALQAFTPSTPRRSPRAGREVRQNTALRQGRTCYDHLAGVAGVELLDALCERGWVSVQAGDRPRYCLTPQGTQALAARGVDIPRASKARRMFAYGCLDWTERRPHLGGALGAAIFEALSQAGIVRRQRQPRAVTILQPLTAWLDRAVVPTER